VVAIVFGVLALIWPGVTVVGLALLRGVRLVDGVTAVAGTPAAGTRDGGSPTWSPASSASSPGWLR